MSINLYKKKTINNQPVLEELLSKSTDTVDNKPLVYDSTTDNVKSVDNLNVNSVTASCFHGPLDGTAKNATCFDNKTYAEACADILSGCAADSNKLNGKTYSEVCSDILSGCAADSNKLNGKTYSEVCSDILSGTAANSTCFAGKTCTEWKDIIKTTCVDNAALATNATCFNGCTYAQACTDIRDGLATQVCADAIQNCADFIQSCVSAIESKIPAQASASNQLADKDFVNSSITTNTANFRGTYACVAELPTTGNTNNDYAFICSLNTTTGNYIYDRYKWVASDSCWVCEYELNTTGFTAEQLASINSGITSNLVAKITDVYDNTVTVCMNGECKGSFNLNQNTDVCIDLGDTIRNACCADYATSAAQASEATNATKFDNKTYNEAYADIRTGTVRAVKIGTSSAVTPDGTGTVCLPAYPVIPTTIQNATCFDGCTYACAKEDFRNGMAAAISIGDSCPYQADGNRVVHIPAYPPDLSSCDGLDCTGTVTQIKVGETAYDPVSGVVSLPEYPTIPTTIQNATCFDGCTYACAKKDILSGCAADSAKLGNKDASCYIDNSSTVQTKAGNLSIGAPAACTSTSAGGNGTTIRSGALEMYVDTPLINMHYNKYCGTFSGRIINREGRLDIDVNNGKGCTAADQTNTYCFKSDGTFTGACTICASCNIYSAGCPVVTTGNIATVAPGYNCTGTSNYVVTTMVCCACHAKTIDRTATDDSHDWHIPLTWSNTTDTCTTFAVSCGCPLTYKPSTGTMCISGSVFGAYQVCIPSPDGTTKYVLVDVGSSIISNLKAQVYTNSFNINKADANTCITSDGISNYGICGYAHVGSESSPSTCLWLKITNWRPVMISGACPLKIVQSTATDPGCTWVEPILRKDHYINTSSANAEYPLVFSTCCATPAAGNRTLYNDSANNLMYNPSTNTLTTTRIRGSTSVVAGNPTACTSTQPGGGGATLGGGIELYHATPFIDFHVNNACADFSHRLQANDGYLRFTATNATGCTAATQTANFDFCSDGTFDAQKLKNGVRYRFSSTKADNGGRKTIHLLYDMTCAVCCTNCGYAINGTVYTNRAPSATTSNPVFSAIDFVSYMPYGSSGIANSQAYFYCRVVSDINNVIVTRNDGKIYAGMLLSGSSRHVSYDVLGSTGVICEACQGSDSIYKDASGCTYTIAKEGSLAQVTSCVSNAVCANTVCRNQAATGTWHLALFPSNAACGSSSIHASSACPLTYNPATGVLCAACFCGNVTASGQIDCAVAIKRYQATTGECHIALFNGNTAVDNACAYVSNGCPITYNPATGVLTAKCFAGQVSLSTTSEFTCINCYTANDDYDMAIVYGGSQPLGNVGVAEGTHRITFNPATGKLATTCISSEGYILKCSSTTSPNCSYICGDNNDVGIYAFCDYDNTSRTILRVGSDGNTALGYCSCALNGLATAVGYLSFSNIAGVAVGTYACAATEGVAIGSCTCSSGPGIAIGHEACAEGLGPSGNLFGMALGYGAYSISTCFGSTASIIKMAPSYKLGSIYICCYDKQCDIFNMLYCFISKNLGSFDSFTSCCIPVGIIQDMIYRCSATSNIKSYDLSDRWLDYVACSSTCCYFTIRGKYNIYKGCTSTNVSGCGVNAMTIIL